MSSNGVPQAAAKSGTATLLHKPSPLHKSQSAAPTQPNAVRATGIQMEASSGGGGRSDDGAGSANSPTNGHANNNKKSPTNNSSAGSHDRSSESILKNGGNGSGKGKQAAREKSVSPDMIRSDDSEEDTNGAHPHFEEVQVHRTHEVLEVQEGQDARQGQEIPVGQAGQVQVGQVQAHVQVEKEKSKVRAGGKRQSENTKWLADVERELKDVNTEQRKNPASRHPAQAMSNYPQWTEKQEVLFRSIDHENGRVYRHEGKKIEAYTALNTYVLNDSDLNDSEPEALKFIHVLLHRDNNFQATLRAMISVIYSQASNPADSMEALLKQFYNEIVKALTEQVIINDRGLEIKHIAEIKIRMQSRYPSKAELEAKYANSKMDKLKLKEILCNAEVEALMQSVFSNAEEYMRYNEREAANAIETDKAKRILEQSEAEAKQAEAEAKRAEAEAASAADKAAQARAKMQADKALVRKKEEEYKAAMQAREKKLQLLNQRFPQNSQPLPSSTVTMMPTSRVAANLTTSSNAEQSPPAKPAAVVPVHVALPIPLPKDVTPPEIPEATEDDVLPLVTAGASSPVALQRPGQSSQMPASPRHPFAALTAAAAASAASVTQSEPPPLIPVTAAAAASVQFLPAVGARFTPSAHGQDFAQLMIVGHPPQLYGLPSSAQQHGRGVTFATPRHIQQQVLVRGMIGCPPHEEISPGSTPKRARPENS